MDFATEAVKNIQAALDKGANLVYVCPLKNPDRAAIESTVKADKVWRPEFSLCERKDELWAVLDPALLVDYADMLPKPVIGELTQKELDAALALGLSPRAAAMELAGEALAPNLGVKNLPALVAAETKLAEYEGPAKVLHPRPQEIGGIELPPEPVQPAPLIEVDVTKLDSETAKVVRILASEGKCTIRE